MIDVTLLVPPVAAYVYAVAGLVLTGAVVTVREALG